MADPVLALEGERRTCSPLQIDPWPHELWISPTLSVLSNESILCFQIPIALGIYDKLRRCCTRSVFETISKEVDPGERKQ
jgi:hypothetical protein